MANVNPVYPPAAGGQGIDSTKYFAAAILLNLQGNNDADLSVTCPASVATLNLTTTPGTTVPISTTVVTPTVTVGNFQYSTLLSTPAPGMVTVHFNILGDDPIQRYWSIEGLAAAVSNFSIQITGATLAQLVGDPSIAPVTTSGTLSDSAVLSLSGTVSVFNQPMGGALPPGIPPLPGVVGAWTQLGPANVSADLTGQVLTPGASSITVATPPTCLAPVVKSSTAFNFGLVGTYTGTSFTASQPSNTWEGTVTVNPRSRQMILVFDRTGSMGSPLNTGDPSKFDVASQAAYIWADIWSAFRTPVTGAAFPDKVGILVFDNETGSWGTFTPAADLMMGPPPAGNAGVPLDVTSALSLNAAPNVGFPRDSTAIGDALISAMDHFDISHADTNTEYIIVLLTDGYENCGHVVLNPATSPAGTVNWVTESVNNGTGNSNRQQTAEQLVIYSIGFGSMVDMGALATLPSTIAAAGAPAITHVGSGPTISVSGNTTGSFSVVVKITSGGAVGTSQFTYSLDGGGTTFGPIATAATFNVPGTGLQLAFPAGTYVVNDTYSFIAQTNLFGSRTGPVGLYGQVSTSTDLMRQLGMFTASAIGANSIAPTPHAAEADLPLYFQVNGHEQILVLAVAWSDATTTLNVQFSQGGGAFTSVTSPPPAGVTIHPRSTHGLVIVDLAALAGSTAYNQALTSTWRINSALAGTAVDISQQTLCMVDLYLNANFKLDKPTYRIGDPIQITCTLQAGGKPVNNARVEVVTERPTEGLGTFLALNGKGFVPIRQPKPPKDRQGGSNDPLHPKPAMFSQLLAGKGLTDLPIQRAPAIFADGSDVLRADGTHTGLYTNTFIDTAKEGAHTWTFVATGTLPGGDTFSRTFTVSTWVGVKIDPASSPVTLTFGAVAPAGFLGATIDVLPKSSNGEYLGPFRSGDISFTATGGTLQGTLESTPDGHYRQVIFYKPGDVPVVTVTGQGTPFPPTIVTTNPLCRLWHELPCLLHRLLGDIECHVCGCNHPQHTGYMPGGAHWTSHPPTPVPTPAPPPPASGAPPTSKHPMVAAAMDRLRLLARRVGL